MNQPIPMTIDSTPLPQTSWRPPGWRDGADDDFGIEDLHTPENTEQRYEEYDKKGYYTRGGLLTEKGSGASDSQTAEDVAFNRKALRDAWNTHPVVWHFAKLLTGVPFTVDPFWNQGAQALPDLRRTLNGLSLDVDGLLTVERAAELLAHDELKDKKAAKLLTKYLAQLARFGTTNPNFPACWRGDLPRGQAAAACNGPHSITEKWLTLADAYAAEEFVACFVPDNGDQWFQEIAMRFDIIVRLGRVSCLPPPGIKSSSPRGASALLIKIPPTIDRSKLPTHTQAVLAGDGFKVPLWSRKLKGTQYGYVQPGSRAVSREIDLGLRA
jgi:hypothetical protein